MQRSKNPPPRVHLDNTSVFMSVGLTKHLEKTALLYAPRPRKSPRAIPAKHPSNFHPRSRRLVARVGGNGAAPKTKGPRVPAEVLAGKTFRRGRSGRCIGSLGAALNARNFQVVRSSGTYSYGLARILSIPGRDGWR